ncbi:UPF0061 protein [Diplonema papillatum]|nr:UPF0061 protein [Diplonema papillatum]
MSAAGRVAKRSIEQLAFDNASLVKLPVEKAPEAAGTLQRQVRGACFSLVPLSPLKQPTVVGVSLDALGLLDVDDSHPDTAAYLSGSKLIPGSRPAAHCYCGHQFGSFAGQLGDGATMYLGEVVNNAGTRWELQIKGGGLTPYSRTADGRKVLRSSLREFLCSEAMYYLGVPTTRSGSLVVSGTDTVVRDIKYDGHPKAEPCAVITRLAPTFLRFGSFETCKPTDASTDRAGPNAGDTSVLTTLIQHVKTEFFASKSTVEMYRDVVLSTAYLVAKWQSIGWCHGVLNTDNMSILGLTIDYGPYGFMEHFDKDYICNGSDHGGRYTYGEQPRMCKWNLDNFLEDLVLAEPEIEGELRRVSAGYDELYRGFYYNIMGRKLGVVEGGREPTDETGRIAKLEKVAVPASGVVDLVDGFMDCLTKTRGDFTKCFRRLTAYEEGVDTLVETLVLACPEPAVAVQTLQARAQLIQLMLDPTQLAMILQQDSVRQAVEDPANTDPHVAIFREEKRKLAYLQSIASEGKKLGAMGPSSKRDADGVIWRAWAEKYVAFPKVPNAASQMNSLNPCFILRQWVLEQLIRSCHDGDYAPLHKIVERIKTPYEEAPEFDIAYKVTPAWAPALCVTCSS